jgi:hypothetical protein
MIFLWTEAGLNNIALNGLESTLVGRSARLFANNIGFSWTRALGDLVEATYTGYTTITIAAPPLAGPYQDPILQNEYYKLPMASFGECTALPQTIYGMFLADTDMTTLYGMLVFDQPMTLLTDSTPRVNILFGMGQGAELSGNELDLS